MLTALMTSVLKCCPIVILWAGLETRAMSEGWREKFHCMATQTAHLKMSAPNYRAVSGANPLTLFTASSQTSVETPVKNAFSAADGAGQPIPAIPGRLVLCAAASPGILRCHYCTITAADPSPKCTYIIYAGNGMRNAEGGQVGEATGNSHPIAFGRAERQRWQSVRDSCHSGLWWLHAETLLQTCW